MPSRGSKFELNSFFNFTILRSTCSFCMLIFSIICRSSSFELITCHIIHQVGVDRKTCIDWFNFLRDVCSADLLANPRQIGGPGHIVAIDESVVAKAKPANGHARPIPPQWVLVEWILLRKIISCSWYEIMLPYCFAFARSPHRFVHY